MKKIGIILFALSAYNALYGQINDSIWNRQQSDIEKEFETVFQQIDSEFNTYTQHVEKEIKELNAEYEVLMRQVWEEYAAIAGLPLPKEEMPPIVLGEDERKNQRIDKIPIEIIPIPIPMPQPKPIAPIRENDVPSNMVEVLFYNTPIMVRKPVNLSFSIRHIDNNSLADAWKRLSNGDYDNLVHDCIENRDAYALSDWAYLNFLQALSEQLFGKSNEAVFLQAYVYALSGYSMRLAYSNHNKLYMFIESQYALYDRYFYSIDNRMFYPFENVKGNFQFSPAGFKGEKALTLQISKEQRLNYNASVPQKHISGDGMALQCVVNKNSIDFYNSYPSGQIGEDFGTRWATYANVPMDRNVQETLYPKLMEYINGMSEIDAVGKILNWIQTGFEYQYDDTVWGYDRAFFPTETLYYPYSDCEDHAILFSRLVRDLLGLDVVLLYYPGHLATAVKFNSDVKGDYIEVKGNKFIVCDPTCSICGNSSKGAPVGLSCVKDKVARVIILQRNQPYK